MPHLTPSREASAEFEVKGSRFIAHLIPIAAFDERVEVLWGAHRKASHIVTAIRCVTDDDSIVERAKDDGEPGGTAGMPALKVLIGHDVVEAGVAIVRYFGGTKLGTGGLARAYGGAAALAVEAADLVPWYRFARRALFASFADTSAVETVIAGLELTVVARDYTATGTALVVSGPEHRVMDAALAEWAVAEV